MVTLTEATDVEAEDLNFTQSDVLDANRNRPNLIQHSFLMMKLLGNSKDLQLKTRCDVPQQKSSKKS